MVTVLQAIEKKHSERADYRVFVLAALGFYLGDRGSCPKMIDHRGSAVGWLEVM